MNDPTQLQNIVEEIVNSYELKVKAVISLIREAHQRIKDYHVQQDRMIKELKNLLARSECLRKKDFDTLMVSIRSRQYAREKEVGQIVEGFCKEEEEIVAKLKEILTGKNPLCLENFKILKEKMLNRPKEREKRVSKMLKDFHRDQEELNTVLKKLLDKGHSVRIKDFKAMVKAFHIEHKDENQEVDKILEEFEGVKEKIRNQWQRVIATADK